MEYIYGTFSDNQIKVNASLMHSEVHKLLLYKDSNVENLIFANDEEFLKYYQNLLYRFGGLNELLEEPDYMISLMSSLQSAYSLVQSSEYNWKRYRQLILDAHGYITLMFSKEG